MQAVVFSNQFGPAQVWLLDGSASPPSAFIPPEPDDRARRFSFKGPGLTWQQWAAYLARETPQTEGSWMVTMVPDGTTPQQALNLIRRAAIAAG